MFVTACPSIECVEVSSNGVVFDQAKPRSQSFGSGSLSGGGGDHKKDVNGKERLKTWLLPIGESLHANPGP
jgi:hypothetical protein